MSPFRRDGHATGRAGYTLVELLVALALTGIVVGMAAQWIVHEARTGNRLQRGVDADEALALFRNALFQDLHRGRFVSLTRERMLLSQGGGGSDTVVWAISEGRRLERTFQGVTTEPLAFLRDLEISWEPAPLPLAGEGFGSAWWRLDRDQDGRIGTEEIDSLGFVLVHLRGTVPMPAGLPPVQESLTVAVPAAGL
jgi:prepilin-type N-terminal cleavage/methylation domain-containing protein